MIILLTYISSGHGEPFAWAIAGLAAGIYLFYRGFRLLQRKRLIMDTPTSKIRSAAMGLVEVSGLAVGPYTITAPVTGHPCYYHRTMAWEYRQQGRSSKWVKVADESFHLPFYLDDNTGRLLVNPQGAEMDIHRDYHQEFNTLLAHNLEMPANVFSFLTRHGINADKKLKVEEYCIKPKNALFVLGTLSENSGLEVRPTPQPTANASHINVRIKVNGKELDSALAAPVLDRLEHLPGVTTTRTITLKKIGVDGAKQEVIRLNGGRGPASTTDMTQQQRIAAALTKAGITNPAAWAAAGLENLAAPAGMSTLATSVAPESGGAAAGTAAEGFDLRPPTVLMKGEHQPAFFISWRSQKDVVKSLGWKSAAMIWGGPALTLLCAYYLLVYFAGL